MPNKRNKTYISIVPQLECSWLFEIRSKTENISDRLEESLSILKEILECSDDFFVPTEIEYRLRAYSEEYLVKDLIDLDTDKEPVESKVNTVTCSGGISYQKLANSVRSAELPADTVCYPSKYIITGTRVCMYVDGSNHEIDRGEEEYYKMWSRTDQGRMNQPPFSDPLSITIRQSFDGESYIISIGTPTDIWFEDTESGRINRKRLSDFLTCVFDNLDTVKVEYHSNYYQTQMADFISN